MAMPSSQSPWTMMPAVEQAGFVTVGSEGKSTYGTVGCLSKMVSEKTY